MKKRQRTKMAGLPVFPVILAAGLVPLIVHEYGYDTMLSVFDWFPDAFENQTDFFLGWKMVAVTAIGALAALLLLYCYRKKKETLQPVGVFAFLFLYLLFVGVSALVSPYKSWVVKGSFELLEPVWTLIAYVILCFYAFQCASDEVQTVRILWWSCTGFAVAALIGTFQAFGIDFFPTTVGKMLFLNPGNWDEMNRLTFNFDKVTYMTVYNPDYVVLYAGLFLPVIFALCMTTKEVRLKVGAGIVCALAVICLFGCRTATTPIALAVACLMVVLVLLSRERKKFWIGITATTCCAVLAAVLLFTMEPLAGIKHALFGTVKMEESYGVQAVETNNTIMFNYRGTYTHFIYEPKQGNEDISIYCISADGNAIAGKEGVTEEGYAIWEYSDGNYGTYIAMPAYVGDELGLNISIDGTDWCFVRDENGNYQYYAPSGKTVKYQNVERIALFNDDVMNGRGHIWNLTLPLLWKHVLLGSGANTFALEYPQNDYIYRTYLGINGTFDVKPHNWYLQQWVENGLLALLCMLAFFFYYLLQSVRIYRRVSFKENLHRIGFGIFSGLLVYMIAGIANDSTVNTAPPFWVMLGLGSAVNRIILREEENLL